MIPANPCHGVRVTAGEFEPDRLVTTPLQGLRAAMRLYQSEAGLSGFVLCLLDLYTGARWGELVGQQRHEYDAERRAIAIEKPLKEVGGRLLKGGHSALDGRDDVPSRVPTGPGRRRGKSKKGRTKTPTGTRWVELPPIIAVFYEELMDSHRDLFVLCSPEGKPLRRSNFRNRFWRPVWDGVDPNRPDIGKHQPAILSTFTFHEGRHSHNTWLAEDGIPEVARRARPGQKMKGIARVYDHVTPEMRRRVILALEARWAASLLALTSDEKAVLGEWFPHLRGNSEQRQIESARPAVSFSTVKPCSSEEEQGF